MLGGPVIVTTTNLQPSATGSCTFTLHQPGTTAALQITVTTDPHPACPIDSKQVPAIGNEAQLCTKDDADLLAARVRTLFFTVRLSIRGTPPANLDTAHRQTILQRVAEQVAGSLY